MTYKEKLQSPKWQKKRLEILQRDNFKCFDCGNSELQLHVHHEMYFNDLEPWECPDECLTTLCSNCHEMYHIVEKQSEFVQMLYRFYRSHIRQYREYCGNDEFSRETTINLNIEANQLAKKHLSHVRK